MKLDVTGRRKGLFGCKTMRPATGFDRRYEMSSNGFVPIRMR
jgi:hypothetical protein